MNVKVTISQGQDETSGKKVDKLRQDRCEIRTGEDK
jgi:hypothetical protein